MPRRRRGLTAAAATLAGALAAASGGCQTDNAGTGCELAQEVVLPASPLTLLPAPRLDRVRDGYVLIGADDADLRWAPIAGATSQLGAERSAALETPRAGLWYGVAGAQSAADTVLAAVGLKAANGVDEEIHVVPLPSDGSAGPASGPVLATVAGGAAPGARPLVAMGSSRLGMAAGLAWVDPTSHSVMLAVLGGSGEPVTSPLVVDNTATAYGCLGFQPGHAELTLGYYKYLDTSTPTPAPTLVLAEVHENGSIDSTLSLTLSSKDAACPLGAPTETGGYALVWQDSIGTWLSVYDPGTNRLSMDPVAGAVTFGGADLQPPLAGFSPVGADYVVVFAKLRATELWRIDSGGVRRRGTLGFPSAAGNLGTVSSLPVSGSLYTTYADYTAVDGDVGTAGGRYLLDITCL